MAVIKCSNCENEILDNEIVCPYCDFPLNKTKSLDGATGKIPVAKETEEPKLATSSDFEKEKAAILKDINMSSDMAKKDENPIKDDSDLEKTVKISRDEILNGKIKSGAASGAVLKEKSSSKSSAAKSRKSKKSSRKRIEKKYIILAVTLLGVILIGTLVSKISDTISDGINRQKKTNKTVAVKSSAEEIEKQQGFTFSSSTLTITDDKVMIDYESAEATPWYQYRDSIKHLTISGEVTKVGAHAFDGFKNITDVTISKSVTSIGDFAFYNCTSLKRVLLPDDNELEQIGESAFELCENLESITGYTKDANFELLLAVVGDRAFAHCTSITEFKLPDDVELGEDVFVGHSDDFAIICSKSGSTYEYATENNISVKEDFDMLPPKEEILEEAEEIEEKEEEEESAEQTQEPGSDEDGDDTASTTTGNNAEGVNNNGTTGTDSGNTSGETGSGTNSPAPSTGTDAPQAPNSTQNNGQALEDLNKKLAGATTAEEEQEILKEMEKYY